jgi:hypothetical protein
MSGLDVFTAKGHEDGDAMILNVGERISVYGPLTHEWMFDEAVEGIAWLRIVGNINFKNSKHEKYRLIKLDFKSFHYLERVAVAVGDFYYDYPWPPLMANSKFRTLLKNYLLNMLETEKDLLDVQRIGIEQYLQGKFAAISDGSGMIEQIRQAQNRISITNPDDVHMMRAVLSAYGISPACDSEIMFENTEQQ